MAATVTVQPHQGEYAAIMQHGIHDSVAKQLVEIYKTGALHHWELDVRALEALRDFPVPGVIKILLQFAKTNLKYVNNKSAFLCGMMKAYKRHIKDIDTEEFPVAVIKGPNQEKLERILFRTGYTLNVTAGQRKFGGPPPGWVGPSPSEGSQIFINNLPDHVYEDALIPILQECGDIFELRLMTDPVTGGNKGFAFVTFTCNKGAKCAVEMLNQYEIAPNAMIKVIINRPKVKLFIGHLPNTIGKEEIMNEVSKITPGLMEVIVCSPKDDRKCNKSYGFLTYNSHQAASYSKRLLGTGKFKLWDLSISVNWAYCQDKREQTSQTENNLYIYNLTSKITAGVLKNHFGKYGKIETITRIRNFAFVTFQESEKASIAKNELEGTDLLGCILHIAFARPKPEKKSKYELYFSDDNQGAVTETSTTQVQGENNGIPLLHSKTEVGGNYMHRDIQPFTNNYNYDYFEFGPRQCDNVAYKNHYTDVNHFYDNPFYPGAANIGHHPNPGAHDTSGQWFRNGSYAFDVPNVSNQTTNWRQY